MPVAALFAAHGLFAGAAMLVLKSLVLPLCLLLSSGGCNPKLDPTGPEPSETLTATEIAGIRLTYMCGNTFRVRNPNDQEAAVTWDVYQKNETGSLTLPPKPAGALHSESFFTTVNKGTVRLFYNGQLIQTKANGNKPPCQSTTRPAIPDSPSEPDDSAFTAVSPTDPDFVYYRRLYDVVFLDNATDAQVLAFFAKYQASIVGGAPLVDIYTVQVPDPGPNFQAVDSLVNAMNAEPGVEAAASVARTSPKGPLHGRYPNDGAGYARDSWFGSSVSTWALRAIRAPLAWGCETGTYSTDKVKVAVLEQAFIPDPDLPTSLLTRVIAPDGRGAAMNPNTVKHFEEHGRGVAGLIGAQGDNNQGAAGVMWRSDLVVYELTGANQRIDNDVRTLERHFVPDLIRRQPRVLSISSEIYLEPAQTGNQKVLTATIDRLLRRVPGLLIIKASGDSSRTLSIEGAKSAWTANAIRAALLRARDNGHANRILFVAGTQPGEAYWPGSDWITAATEIAAPAREVGLLPGPTGESVLGEGTSFAAPLVAGVAAQLLAMDPTLTPAQVKEYVLRGAQEPRVDPASGALIPASTVAGAPGGVYQLDAYGALTLLAKERAGTPICGFPVSLTEAPDAVLLQRRQNAVEPVPMPSRATAVSVAQGGRLMAVSLVNSDGTESQPHEFTLHNGAWSDARTLSQVHERRYLERDTVDLRWDEATNHSLATIRRADGSVTQIDLNQTAEPTQLYGFAVGGPFFSPGGDFAIVGGHYTLQEGCPTWIEGQRWHLLRLPSGPTTLLEDDVKNTCGLEQGEALTDDGGTAAWSLDGTRFALGVTQFMLSQPYQERYTLYQSRLMEGVVSGTGPTIRDVTTSGRSVHPYAYSAGSETIAAQEIILVGQRDSECMRTTRLVRSLATIVTEDPIACSTPSPVLMNSMASLRAGGLGSRLAETLKVPRGGKGVRPAGPRRVQVN